MKHDKSDSSRVKFERLILDGLIERCEHSVWKVLPIVHVSKVYDELQQSHLPGCRLSEKKSLFITCH